MNGPIVLFTQRVDVIKEYSERRDSADQQWAALLAACGCLPVPVPNAPALAAELAKRICPSMIVLTGGNNIACYQGDAPERDATEEVLLAYAKETNTPVLGICRGMQMLQHYFGGVLYPREGHVRTKHQLVLEGISREVNSFHRLCILEVAPGFVCKAQHQDGVVEAMVHENQLYWGIMWHPEREVPFQKEDIRLIQKIVESGKR